MSLDRNAERMEDEAIAWQVRLKDASVSAEDRERFRQWLHASPEHGAAYDRACALWREMAAPARRLGAGNWYRAAAARPPMAPRWRHAFATMGLAGLVLAGMIWRDPGLNERLTADLASPPGQTRETVLPDGSTVFLDGDSAVDFAVNDDERRIVLRRGRAWFDVTHTGIPFSVTTGEAEVLVLGTAFAVERCQDATSVMVERGRVAVAAAERSESVILDPGQQVMVQGDRSPPTPASVDAGTALAWRRGLAVFDRATVADVAAQVERLRPGRVIVVGDDLRRQTLSGVFSADSPDAILAALSTGLGVTVTTLPGVATIIQR